MSNPYKIGVAFFVYKEDKKCNNNVEYTESNTHSLKVTKQSDVVDVMETSNKKLTIYEEGTYQYINSSTNTKMKVFVAFSDTENDKKIAEEVTAILKNNYLKRILSGSMQNDLEEVQSIPLLEPRNEGTVL